MLVSPVVSDQGYASTINSPICSDSSETERFSEKHLLFMQRGGGEARIDMNSPLLVSAATTPDSSFANTSAQSSPRAGAVAGAAKYHRQKDSLSSSISFGANRAGLKNSKSGAGAQYPSSLAVSVSNTPILGADEHFGQKPSFWDSAPYWLYVFRPTLRSSWNRSLISAFALLAREEPSTSFSISPSPSTTSLHSSASLFPGL